MENLVIPGTKTTPNVNFNAETGILELSGESYPENALEFYKKIYEWLKTYLAEFKGNVTFTFNMIYFNTSSSKAILDILDILEEQYKITSNITVNWKYQTDDEDIQESGEEFAEDLTLPYNLVAYD